MLNSDVLTAIDAHMSVVENLTVRDDDSARAAIPHLMAAAAAINVVTAPGPGAELTESMMSFSVSIPVFPYTHSGVSAHPADRGSEIAQPSAWGPALTSFRWWSCGWERNSA